MEWKELTKRDAQHSLGLELDRLLLTAGAGDKERIARYGSPESGLTLYLPFQRLSWFWKIV